MSAIYNFKGSSLIVDGTDINSFDDTDTAVSINPAQQTFTRIIGADGEGHFAQSADESGDLVFQLLQNSSSNAYMSRLVKKQKSEGSLFDVRWDSGDGYVATLSDCVVESRPIRSFGKGSNSVEYTILAIRLEETTEDTN